MSAEHSARRTNGAADRNPVPHHLSGRQQQFESGRLGMWIFLATELLIFGGLFCAYAVYRARHPEVFLYAHRYLDATLGGINTVVLICSSFTMAWAVRCAQIGARRALVILLVLTLVLACAFLGIKFVEYKHKWEHGLLWGKAFDGERVDQVAAHDDAAAEGPDRGAPDDGHGEGASGAAPRRERPSNLHIFFGIYFVMTGLHAVHVLGGMGVIGWLIVRAQRGDFTPEYFFPVDYAGLYWHLVDIVWIFLFPLLYLIH